MIEPIRELARSRLGNRVVIAFLSGKGGVGKSTISALASILLSQHGETTLVDLDIHGTSIPRLMGISERTHEVGKEGIEPIKVVNNLGIVSVRGIVGSKYLVLPGEREGGVMEALLAFTNYGNSRFIVIDMPPGMSDELLVLSRVANYVPVVITTPSRQSLYVVEDVIRYLVDSKLRPKHLVINMAYLRHGNEILRPFGESRAAQELGARYGMRVLELPIDPGLEGYVGRIMEYRGEVLTKLNDLVIELVTH